ncbi:hypothetical protein [Sphingomonas radiodurans]|uniref:hypothetical protein n=1 Tax=Sphingomonas radiodurans TaxID=2890321 RepID=UPI001E54686A|nr:hypothetical protein [Sphingomonas radiodurans]WBH16610.1 hypothetical protein LLW23_00285 [Sphingomonas radiodurans]
MNLLLLLSALLSALTGVGGSLRTPVPTVVEGSIAVRRAPVAAYRLTERPVASLPSLARVAAGGLDRIFAPIVREPVFASRRRE